MSTETLSGKELFDHEFFLIALSRRETQIHNPLFTELTLKHSWKLGKNDFVSLQKSNVGVFVGSSYSDFHSSLLERDVVSDKHIGAAGSMLANSISRFFGFKGVSMKVDSARSSSFQALDAACQYLRTRACDVAVVAGSNFILDKKITEIYEKMNMVGAENNKKTPCKAFGDSKGGYARQEAAVVVILSSKSELQLKGIPRKAKFWT